MLWQGGTMTQDVVCAILDAGIDWLTLTEPLASEAGNALHACTMDWLVGSCEAGAGLEPQKPQGFDGAGNEFGFMGVRDGLLMARVSGRNAGDYFAKLMEYGQSFHCTRIDTQVTARYAGGDVRFAQRMHGAIRATERGKALKRQATTVLYQNDFRDTGVSVGARTGEAYLRAYHPLTAGHREYGPEAIRFEVEWKGSRAAKVFRQAAKADGVQYLAASLVQAELLARGVVEPWFQAQNIERPKTDYSPTDNKRRFEWFERSVVPCIERLMQDPAYRVKIHHLYEQARDASGQKRRSAALEVLQGEAAYFKAKEYETS
jgi:hypothetical protein